MSEIKTRKRAGVKVSLVLLSLLLFLLIFAPVAAAAIYGDINDDGDVDVQDVVLAMKHALGLELLTGTEKSVADVNGDSDVDVQDVTLIMQYSLGLIDDFPMRDLEVSSVKALNARQVEVVFNRKIVDEPVENLLNYEVYKQGSMGTNVFGVSSDGAVAQLLEDGKTVLLTLNDGQQFTNYTTTNRVIVKEAVGLKENYTNSAVVFTDTTVPTLVSVESIGKRTIALNFSEPVKPSSAPLENIALNDGAIALDLNNAKYIDSKWQVVINTFSDLTAGTTYTVTLRANHNLEDYVGLKVVPSSKTFVHTPLTTAPTVSAEAISEKTLRLTFNRSVTLTTAGANVEFRYGYNTSGAMKRTSANMNGAAASFATSAVVGSGNTKYDITFENPMNPGSGMVYIHYLTDTDAAGRIADGFGNVLPNNSSVSFTVVPDTNRPTVTSVTVVNNTTIDVTFSEPVTGATATNNYTLTNPQGNAVTITSATLKAGTLTSYRLAVGSLAAGGAFTFTVKDEIKDLSVAQNKLVPYSTVLNVTDSIAPFITEPDNTTLSDKYYRQPPVPSKKVRIYFSEEMNSADLADKTKYQNAAYSNANPLVASPATNGMSVYLEFANDVTGNLNVGNLRDLAGNTFAGFAVTLQGADAPEIGLDKAPVAETTGTVKLFLDDIVLGVNPADFEVDNGIGNWLAPTDFSQTVVNGKTVITLILPDSHKLEYDADSAEVRTVSSPGNVGATTNAKNAYGVPINIAAEPIKDKISPVIGTAVFVDNETIHLTFEEKMESDTFAPATRNGFAVSGSTGIKTYTQNLVDSEIVVVKWVSGTKFTAGVSVVTYDSSLANITDANGNALASFTKTTQ